MYMKGGDVEMVACPKPVKKAKKAKIAKKR
jgi:hypothetical protein